MNFPGPHMNFQNESLFHFRRLQHGVKKSLYNVIWVCEVTTLLKKIEKSLDSILQFLWQSSVYPETIVMLLTSYTDTVTWVAVLTGNVICSCRASLWVRASIVCLSQEENYSGQLAKKIYVFCTCLLFFFLLTSWLSGVAGLEPECSLWD